MKMTKKILVPESYTEDEPQGVLQKAYVKQEERYLDPTKLTASVLDKLPSPSGWRLTILPYRGRGVTKGGLHLADEYVDRQALASIAGYVLKMGPLAYADKEKFPTGPWCKVGDWVLIARYSGARFLLEDGEVRIINDDDVMGTLLDPEDLRAV